MNKKYRIIVADPPWQYGSKSAVNNSNGSEIKKLSEHYKSMSTDDIKSLPIKNILLEDACCFLWVTDSHLKEGIEAHPPGCRSSRAWPRPAPGSPGCPPPAGCREWPRPPAR